MERVEQIENLLIINDEPEFSANDTTKVSAEFFILCEENADVELSKNVFDCKLCGMSILNWVVRACLSQPKIIHVEAGTDALSAIRPYISGEAEYWVSFDQNGILLGCEMAWYLKDDAKEIYALYKTRG